MKKKELSKAEALKIIGGSIEYWGSTNDRIPKIPHDANNISLAAIDKKGNEIEWYGKGWAGVVEYAAALGVDYVTVGEWLEKNFGNRATLNQVLFAQAVHASLAKVDYYRRPRIKMAPSGKESDMHYAIRMDLTKIKRLYYAAGGGTKDFYKGAAAMYKRIYKARPKYVEAYLYKHQHTKAEREELAKIKGRVIGSDKIFSKIFPKK